MADQKPINSCQHCGGTAYKPIMQRNAAGVMARSGRYQCAQCGVVFNNIHHWRGDVAALSEVPSTQDSSDPKAPMQAHNK